MSYLERCLTITPLSSVLPLNEFGFSGGRVLRQCKPSQHFRGVRGFQPQGLRHAKALSKGQELGDLGSLWAARLAWSCQSSPCAEGSKEVNAEV